MQQMHVVSQEPKSINFAAVRFVKYSNGIMVIFRESDMGRFRLVIFLNALMIYS